jgi:hypothetical protein
LLFAAIVPNGINRDKTARHIAGLQGNQPIDLSEKSYSVREGCRVNKCSCVLNG